MTRKLVKPTPPESPPKAAPPPPPTSSTTRAWMDSEGYAYVGDPPPYSQPWSWGPATTLTTTTVPSTNEKAAAVLRRLLQVAEEAGEVTLAELNVDENTVAVDRLNGTPVVAIPDANEMPEFIHVVEFLYQRLCCVRGEPIT